MYWLPVGRGEFGGLWGVMNFCLRLVRLYLSTCGQPKYS